MVHSSFLNKIISKLIISNTRVLLYVLLFNQHRNLRLLAIKEKLEKRESIKKS